MSDKAAVEEVAMTGAKPTFGAKLKAHFKKWWWAHLIVFCAVVLIIALPLVYVGYPNIAQGDINDSTLTVESMVITDPTPDGFQLNQKQVIGSGSIFHPKIYSFDADVSLQGSPAFATVTVPEVQARDDAAVHVEQWVDLTDADQFAAFSTAVMMNEEFNLGVYGEPDLKLGALPKIDVTYNKTVTMKGLNKLKGFKIKSLRFDSDREDGNNAHGTVFIPNPSVLQLSMGNITLDISSNGTALGQSFLNDLVLNPGDNNVPMLSNLSNSKLFDIIGDLPAGAPTIPLTIVGKSSVYDGKEIPYFTAALKANELVVDLNILEVI
ncbi:DUF3712 domain-containing protein [Aspergillus lucknowensis]|uniref:DUF2125 domain-containing protein n=1 Tax=Aspergillus lucknowensis TaxID=176173 RepID=A0ABR4L612_9EURO